MSGEFDELFLKDASVHIDRMNTRAFWSKLAVLAEVLG